MTRFARPVLGDSRVLLMRKDEQARAFPARRLPLYARFYRPVVTVRAERR